MEEEEDDDSDADSAITPNSDRNASRAARKKSKPLILMKNGKLDKGKATAGMHALMILAKTPFQTDNIAACIALPQLDVAKWKSLNGWPYRYFGEHVHHESVLDPHDPIWPRASTVCCFWSDAIKVTNGIPVYIERWHPLPVPRYSRRGTRYQH